jgi:NAD(P)-dependent dehydrogenase (short-subunit alcohol dehydrogenase family)
MKRKITMVFGGSRGIGKVISQDLIKRGDKVITISRRKINNKGNQHISCDITSDADLDRLLIDTKELRIDNLVFAQRYRGNNPILDLDLSLLATDNIIKKFLSKLKKESSIVILSSIATTTVLHDQNQIYHYTRGGIESIVKFYACTLGKFGVRINCVQPSKLTKPENKSFFNKKNNLDRKILEHLTPLRRMGDSKDIANLVNFLTSDKSSFITGTIIPVDGGLRLLSQESIVTMMKSFHK